MAINGYQSRGNEMISDQLGPDVKQASETAEYAMELARRIIRIQFGEDLVTVADCVALSAVIVAKLNMMHECDMKYLEMDRWDRRTPGPDTQAWSKKK
jgi:hypothetical protein